MNEARLIGWTLVHSVWEIAAIAAVFYLISLALRRTSASVRYVAALIALVTCLICPVTTLYVLTPASPVHRIVIDGPVSNVSIQSIVSKPFVPVQTEAGATTAPAETVSQRIEPILPAVVICWLIGLAVMCLRLAGGVFVVERIKRKASHEIDLGWQNLADDLSKRLGMRRSVPLLVSDRISTPAVVGFIKTVILFPASAIATLSPASIEALLAHELAHVRRYDYMVNFAQSIVEIVLFFHPGAWWISSVVRAEREHCCDDVAISAIGDREQYARALLSLEQWRRSAPRLAMAANQGSLLARVRRIALPAQRRATSASTWATLAIAIAIGIGLAGTIHAKQSPSKAKTPRPGATWSVSGRVIDVDGKPVEGASVLHDGYDFETKQTRVEETLTDSDGRYRFDAIKGVGDDSLVIKKGLGSGIPERHDDGTYLVRMLPVKQIHLLAVDPSGAPVSGLAIGPTGCWTRSNGMMLKASTALFKRLSCTTDADGRATLENIPAAATAFLETDDPHHVIIQETARLRAPRPDKVMKVVVARAGSISGVVTQGGAPVPYVTVFSISAGRRHTAVGHTDANGRFELDHQPAGDLILKTELNDLAYVDMLGHSKLLRNVSTGMMPVHIFKKGRMMIWANPEIHVKVVADAVQHVELKIRSGAQLRVRVATSDGRPVTDVRVTVADSGSGVLWDADGDTDKDGVFQCRVAPGEHRVTIQDWSESRSQMVTLRQGTPVTLTIGSPIDEENKLILIKLIDADGRPVSGSTVTYGFVNSKGKAVKEYQVSNGYGKIDLYLPASWIKSLWASPGHGNLPNAEKIKPRNGEITLRIPRSSKAVASLQSRNSPSSATTLQVPRPKPSQSERLALGNWLGHYPEPGDAWYPPKDGKPGYHEKFVQRVSLVLNRDHTFVRTEQANFFSRKGPGFSHKGSWTMVGDLVILKGDSGSTAWKTSTDGKSLGHISMDTWREKHEALHLSPLVESIVFARP